MINEQDSKKVLDTLHTKLASVVKDSFNNLRSFKRIENKVRDDVSEKMFGFIRSSEFKEALPKNIKLQNTKVETGGFSGIIEGLICLDYMKGIDFSRYGMIGYAGVVDKQIIQYPEMSDTYYQWDEFMHRWDDVTTEVCGTDEYGNREQSWGSRLTSNAAFEPWWGSNTNGGDIISDRHRNGADDLWGDPGVRKFAPTFKNAGSYEEIVKNIYKSFFTFSVNIKSAVSHFLTLEKTLKDKNIKSEHELKRKLDSIQRERLMVTITINKIVKRNYYKHNDAVVYGGYSVIKDTSVLKTDTTKVRKQVLLKNIKIDKEAHDKFKRGY